MSIKKNITLALAAAVTAASILSLTACGDPCENGHIDEDVDYYCDECGEAMPCDHEDKDGNCLCDLCGAEVPCEQHVDENRDFLCDKCGAFYEAPVVYANMSITVKSEDGAAVSGVTVCVTNSDGETVLNKATGTSGKVSANLPTGEYYVSFELDTDGYVYIPNGFINLTKNGGNFEYVTIDNTPDGSAAKPFFIGENVATYTIAAGATYTFTIKGGERALVIENASIVLNYNGQDYLPEDGKLEMRISGSIDANDPPKAFTVTNTANVETEVTFNFTYDPGTRENPIEVSLNTEYTTSVITNETILYYVWVADASGTLNITSISAGGELKLTNITRSQVSDYTDGSAGATVSIDNVQVNDVILVEISVKSMVAPEDPDSPTEDELAASGSVTFKLTLGE